MKEAMRIIRLISALMGMAVLAVSCMNMEAMMPEDSGHADHQHLIVGHVADTTGRAIEHIKVTLNWNDGAFSETQYTNSDGDFAAGIWNAEDETVKSLTITLEDIDGEENGGCFERLSETFTVFEDNSVTTLDFRLSHATASENTPQS